MLTEKQLAHIKELQNICEEHDHVHLKLNWDMLNSRENGKTSDFFHYENDTLIGFAGIYGFGSKVELCGMVHPDYRRKGIFTGLFKEASTEMKARNFRQILLNTPAQSQSGKAFLTTVRNDYYVTEYQMKWEGESLNVNENDVNIRSSTEADLALEIDLDVACFGFLPAEAKQFNSALRTEGSDQFYIVEFDGKSVGKLRVGRTDGESWIYGFAVLPEHQGKGIGRKALSLTIANENKNGYPVFLEVEAKNAHALKLYESCGFRTYHAQDYYEMKQ